MKYMGSKNRHGKELIPIIMSKHNPDRWYIDPFVGGANMIDKIPAEKRFASDTHYYLIEMFKALQNGWTPPDKVTEREYQEIKDNKQNYEPALVGFVGFGCSYSGKWFGGYARGNSNNGKPRNYCAESKRNVMKQLPNLQGVIFKQKSYDNLYVPKGSTVYCDPPYANTTKYKSGDFDHDRFWQWVRETSKHSTVYVSEYTAPDDFICLWEKKVNNTLVKETGSKQGIEKLFVHESLKV